MCSKLLAAATGLRGADTGLRAACCAFDVNPAKHLSLADSGPTPRARWHTAIWDATAAALLASHLMDADGPLGGPESAQAAHDRIAIGGRTTLRRYMHPHRRDIDLYRLAAAGRPPAQAGGSNRIGP